MDPTEWSSLAAWCVPSVPSLTGRAWGGADARSRVPNAPVAARMAGMQCAVKTVTPGDSGALDMQKKWPAGRRADEDAPGRRCVIAVLAFCAGAVSAGQIDL